MRELTVQRTSFYSQFIYFSKSSLREITFFSIFITHRYKYSFSLVFSLHFQTFLFERFSSSNEIPNFPTDFQFSSLFAFCCLLSFLFIDWVASHIFAPPKSRALLPAHPTLILFYYFGLVWGNFFLLSFFILTFPNFPLLFKGNVIFFLLSFLLTFRFHNTTYLDI